MAVYKRNYRSYEGTLTPTWSRFLVLARYAWADVRSSKFLTMFLMAACFFPVGCAIFIYLKYHLEAIGTQFGVRIPKFKDIEPAFFMVFLNVQAFFAWFLTAFIGPKLVAPDLTNNAMPLFFCRPLSRPEYVLGKASVLLILLSAITWIPGLILWGIEASLAGWDWTVSYGWLTYAMFLSGVMLVVVLTVVALAVSAWVKWRIAASAAILAVFFISAGIANMFNAVLRTESGHWVNIGWLLARIWTDLFRKSTGVFGPESLSVYEAWSGLVLFCIGALFVLERKIRAYEVVS